MLSTDLKIIFEDKYLLALNKPHGLVVEKDPHLKSTLEFLVLDYTRSKEKYPEKCFIGLPHRLDRPVSGVVLFAKKRSVLKMLGDLFFKREVEKKYLAIVKNSPEKKEDELTHWLVKDTLKRKAIIYEREVPHSMEVILRYRCISQNEYGALLEVNLITGKFHQIRAQLAFIGCPIIGDAHYGSTIAYKENGICLHARQLSLIHPITKETLQIVGDIPEDDVWDSFRSFIS